MASKKILCQLDVQAITSLSNPGAGYVGFSAKADGLYQKIGAAADLRLLTSADALNYQPIDADLTAIAALNGAPGLLRTNGSGTWSVDSSAYVVGSPWTGLGYIKDSDFASTGLMTRTGAGVYTITPTSTYSLSGHNHTGVYQPIDADLTAIAGLAGVLGFLVKTDVGNWTLDTSTYALSTHTHAGAYEPVLGNPGTNGHILSSTTAGVRSWGALPLASSTVRGGILITGGTPAAGTLPISLYNESPYVGLTTGAIEYVLNGASITSHKHDTLYAKLAGLSTQAFSTASLTLGNSTGNAPVLTLYGSSPSVFSTIKTTNGNMHLDSYTGSAIYLNWFTGTAGVVFGNGAQGQAASISAAGLITAPSIKLTTGAGAGKILTSDADGDGIWSDPSSAFSAASETAQGAVEIATTAEVLAMSDMLRSITPYTLANAFPNLSANNGYISIPIGFGERMVIQYGSFTANTGSSISFPLAFPLYCYSVVITAGDGIALISAKTRFAFTWHDVQDAVTSAVACNWIAIGK